MSKGFWLVTTTVTNPAFAEYVEAFQPWIESIDGSVFAKDLERVENYQSLSSFHQSKPLLMLTIVLNIRN